MQRKSAYVRPLRRAAGAIAGTQDWYLVLTPKGTQAPVRKEDLNGREPIAGPFETRNQALCERSNP
jgi:hypothetical protein